MNLYTLTQYISATVGTAAIVYAAYVLITLFIDKHLQK